MTPKEIKESLAEIESVFSDGWSIIAWITDNIESLAFLKSRKKAEENVCSNYIAFFTSQPDPVEDSIFPSAFQPGKGLILGASMDNNHTKVNKCPNKS